MGLRSPEARDGREALSICKNNPRVIDLLITDVVMPEMGGRELSEKLEVSCPNMRVLFTSAYTDDAVVRHGVIDTSRNFIQKPYSTADLATKVRSILNKTQ